MPRGRKDEEWGVFVRGQHTAKAGTQQQTRVKALAIKRRLRGRNPWCWARIYTAGEVDRSITP